MDIDHLKTFLELYRTRHFGRTATNLFLSQSAVSSRIKTLEDVVGKPLFIRERNNLHPTATGDRLVRYAENILITWDRARQELAATEKNVQVLQIGALPSLWDSLLLHWIDRIRTQLPQLVLHGDILNFDVAVRRLQEGALDLAFAFDAPAAADLLTREITTLQLIMVSSTQQQRCDDALKADYVYVDWGISFGILHARHFPHLELPVNRMPPGRAARDYLLRHGGSAYLPSILVATDLIEERLYRVTDAPLIERPVHAIYPATVEQQGLIEQVLALLQ